MKYSSILFLFLVYNNLSAPGKLTTIQGVFNISNKHKDGYEFMGHRINLPGDVALKCDKKKIKLIGKGIAATYWEQKEGEPLRQGRSEYIPVKNDTGGISYKQVMTAGATFQVISVSVWNTKTKNWEVVY